MAQGCNPAESANGRPERPTLREEAGNLKTSSCLLAENQLHKSASRAFKCGGPVLHACVGLLALHNEHLMSPSSHVQIDMSVVCLLQAQVVCEVCRDLQAESEGDQMKS